MWKKALPLVLGALIIAAPVVAADQGTITVHVTGLRNDKGVVRMALFNSAASYTNSRGPKGNTQGAFMKGAAPVKTSECTYAFENVPYGEYAIKLFHDEANNGEFETGMFGIPKVEYGFSNNARGKMGPAPYEKAKFNLSQPNMTMEITAHHGP